MIASNSSVPPLPTPQSLYFCSSMNHKWYRMVDAWEGEKKRSDAYFHPDPKLSLYKSIVCSFFVFLTLTFLGPRCFDHTPGHMSSWPQAQRWSAVHAPNPRGPSSLRKHQPCASSIPRGDEGLASGYLSSKSLVVPYRYLQSNGYTISMSLLYLYLPQSYRSGSWSEPEESLPFSKEPGPSLRGNQGGRGGRKLSRTQIWP